MRIPRASQLVLLATFLPACWLLMQAVHELGHVLAAWATGGSVAKVVLHPFALSRTDVAPSPHPAVVVWSGSVVGCVVPALWSWGTSRHPRLLPYLFRFFAGFCLVANGAYLIGGSLVNGADPGEMIRHGAPRTLLMLFGAGAMGGGFWLWNRQGFHFGLGEAGGQVERRAVFASIVLLLVILVVEIAFDSR